MGKVYLYCIHFTCIPFNSVFKYGTFKSTINMGDTIFVTHVLKTYRVWSSPHAWGKTVKNGVRCSAPVPFFFILYFIYQNRNETYESICIMLCETSSNRKSGPSPNSFKKSLLSFHSSRCHCRRLCHQQIYTIHNFFVDFFYSGFLC